MILFAYKTVFFLVSCFNLVLVLVTFSFSHSIITPKWMRSYSS